LCLIASAACSKVVRDLYAYLRFLVNPSDEQALGRVHNTPTRGVGDRGWVNIRAAVTVAKQKSTGSWRFGDLEDYD
jgi:DNA helicase-2/ATP-dependent DNA helicase PcrA